MEEELSVQPSLRKDYKGVCLKLGIMIIIIFLSRMALNILYSFAVPLTENMSLTGAYAVQSLLSFCFLYIIPILSSVFIFGIYKNGKIKSFYSKPKNFLKSMGNTAAVYGFGQMVNILTLVVTYLVTSVADINDSFNTVSDLAPANMGSALILFVQLVVVAPIFEEFWFRGIVMNSLKPYGTGIAIVISAFLFGLTHANFSQFFYATAIGLTLGYISYATGSIWPTTLIHAIFNSISGFLFIFMATPSVQDYLMKNYTGEIPDEDMFILLLFALFGIFSMILIIVGFISAIVKMRQIKRYKVPNSWPEIKGGKKFTLFITSITVIIGILLAADAFLGSHIARLIIGG